MIGPIINGGAVIVGAGIGMLVGNRMTAALQTTVFQALGLCTLSIGMSMTFKTGNPLFMIGSILLGGVAGHLMDLDGKINHGGNALKRAFRSDNARFTEGFVSATLLFCIGSMAIIGSLNEGISGDLTVVLTKSTLDFFAAIAFGSAYGSGVIAAAIPVVVYQGLLTHFAEYVRPYVTDQIRSELEAVGGIMIVGIGINLLDIKKITLSNYLPALIVVVVLCLVCG